MKKLNTGDMIHCDLDIQLNKIPSKVPDWLQWGLAYQSHHGDHGSFKIQVCKGRQHLCPYRTAALKAPCWPQTCLGYKRLFMIQKQDGFPIALSALTLRTNFSRCSLTKITALCKQAVIYRLLGYCPDCLNTLVSDSI